MSLWTNLARRGVIRVAIAYTAAVWLLLQVASVVLPSFDISSWVMQALIVASALGFPIALLLAWFYDWTSQGIKAASEVESNEPVKFTGRKIDFAIIGMLLLAVGFLLVENEATESENSVLANSIAVLPFENLSPNPNDAYFAAGIHSELLGQLAKVDDLQVIARTSVLQFEGERNSISEIANQLRVGTIMEGSVRYAGDKVRVTAQLIDASTNTQIWAEVYERSIEDIFDIQADISERIAASLRAELTTAERQSIARQATNSPEAYALYLRALAAYPDNASMLRFLDQATELDPQFALAYARTAWAHVRFAASVTSVLEHPNQRAEHAGIARKSAETALALNPDLGYAHAQLGRISRYQMRWSEEQQSLERALALSPNDPSVLQVNALLLADAGESAKAKRLIDRALVLDPVSGSVFHGLVPMAYGDWDAAVTALHRINALPGQPQSFAFLELGYAEGARGNLGPAVEAVRIAEQLSEDDRRPSWKARLARSYARAGKPGEALRLVDEIREMAGHQYVSATTWFVAYLALGQYDEAINWLHTAIDENDAYGAIFRQLQTRQDIFDPVWDDPRFQDARRKLGFDSD